MPPGLLVRPTVTTLMSTRIKWDEATGITYMDTVTASMGLVALEMLHKAVDPNMPILEEGAQGESTVSTDVTIYERWMTALNKNIYGIPA